MGDGSEVFCAQSAPTTVRWGRIDRTRELALNFRSNTTFTRHFGIALDLSYSQMRYAALSSRAWSSIYTGASGIGRCRAVGAMQSKPTFSNACSLRDVDCLETPGKCFACAASTVLLVHQDVTSERAKHLKTRCTIGFSPHCNLIK